MDPDDFNSGLSNGLSGLGNHLLFFIFMIVLIYAFYNYITGVALAQVEVHLNSLFYVFQIIFKWNVIA